MKKGIVIEDSPAAPVLTPDMVSKIKKEDMKQAVVERFSGKTPAPSTATRSKKRSPYWRPSDEEC